MLKIFLILFVVSLALLSCVLAGPSDPVPRPEQSWMDRHDSFVRNTLESNGSIPIIFYGASIVDFWDDEGKSVWDENYAPLGSVNYGISADHIEHVMWRVLNGEIIGLKPKLIVLHIGGNNIYAGDSDDDIIEGLNKLVNLFQQLLPSTKVLVVAILPRGNATDYARLANANIKTAPLENGDTIRYLNMMDQFSFGWGVLRQELYKSDVKTGVHLRMVFFIDHHVFRQPLQTRYVRW